MVNIHLDDPHTRRHLSNTGKWAYRIALASFVLLGIIAVFVIGFMALGGTAASFSEELADSTYAVLGGLSVFLLIAIPFIAFGVYLILLIYRFGNQLRNAHVDTLTNADILSGFKNFARYLKITVLLYAAILGFAALSLSFAFLFS